MNGKGFMALRLRKPQRGRRRFELAPARIGSREAGSVEAPVRAHREVEKNGQPFKGLGPTRKLCKAFCSVLLRSQVAIIKVIKR
jgi:hypothetical protein